MEQNKLDKLLNILHAEVVPAIGCTEPVAVALCVAKAREKLGVEPKEIHVTLSPNMYKNAMGVGIPNTGKKGLPIAIALGATIGKSEYQLEVLKNTTPQAVEYAEKFMKNVPIKIDIDPHPCDILYICATCRADNQSATATIAGSHTHFVDDTHHPSANSHQPIANSQQPTANSHQPSANSQQPTAIETLKDVYDFALEVPLSDIEWLAESAEMNLRAAEYSFKGRYGHGLGRILHEGANQSVFGNTLFTKILSYTCGACDARMAGAMVPVMSNSGSGNQGISATIPVALYAQEHQCSHELTLRALCLSHLTVIYIKQSLGRLSALCGCVVAATGSACGITMLMGGHFLEITYAINNMIANLTGMICDGAKPGCALKVTSGVATAVMSASLAMQRSAADESEGIVANNIDDTIHNLTQIGHDGMTQTDQLILNIMTNK